MLEFLRDICPVVTEFLNSLTCNLILWQCGLTLGERLAWYKCKYSDSICSK